MSQHFLHYTITSTLEKNAASTTYLAVHDQKPASVVVLKLFHAQNFINISEQEKFLQEAEKLSILSNPLIVPIIETGIQRDQAYIVSAYMPNGSLRVRLDRAYPQRIPMQQAMTIITQIGQGLAYLHARYLVHGQLKPEYVLFNAHGHVLLSDLYCATSPAPWDAHNPNASETYRYLAPEQFSGETNALSDQYALCCVAYELLTGRPPFTHSAPQALKEQQQHMLPGALSPILPDLAPTIEQAILKGLAKEPTQRHTDIITLLAALQTSKAATTPNLPLPRAKRRTRSLAPSISIAPRMPALSPSTQHTEPLAPPPSHPLDEMQQRAETSAMPDTHTARPSDNYEPLDDIFNMLDTPVASAPAATNGTLNELLQEMAIDDELLIRKNTLQPAPTKASEEQKPSFMPVYAADDDESLSAPLYPEDDDANLIPASYPANDDASLIQMSFPEDDDSATQSSPDAPDEDVMPVGILAASRQFSTIHLTQSTSEPAVKNNGSKVAAYRFATSLTGMRTGGFFSKRTGLTVLALLLMIICLVFYSALAIAAPQTSSLALSTPLPTPGATADVLGILPPVASTSSATAALATPQPTVKPTPKPTPKPKPTPTPLPVSLPPTIPTATATPKPTPTPTPKLLYSSTASTQSTSAGLVVLDFLPPVVVNDTRIEADMVIQGNIGGVMFRTSTNGYQMRINTNGDYDLENGKGSLKNGFSSAIKQGNSISNHLTIIANGDQITVSVNGKQIINIQDSSASSGGIGILAADNGTSTTATCVLNVYTD